ncbi:hypothetical protein TIFTF001_030219 [Ficus carica]|uniref:Uncharacterized protein n=1 Tax=Ficus carica TaxID=3494 RepID=A0AA88DTS8_FICCA|nr:hypothetical protein TIFTF001_030219 [Ficus carica]
MNEYSSTSDQEQDDVYSENEYSDDDSYLATAVVAVTASRRNRQRDPQPMHNSILTGSMCVEEILIGYEEIIQGLISATNRYISYLFQHSRETTSRWFFKVLKVICALKDEFIRPPDYSVVQHLILEHSNKYRPWFDVVDPLVEEYAADCVPVRGLVDVNADYVLTDGIDSIGVSTGTQQHESSRGVMNQMREMMADDM